MTYANVSHFTKSTRPKGGRITGKERERLAEELKKKYESGESIRAVATGAKISYGFAYELLEEARVRFRKRGGDTRSANRKHARGDQ